MIHLNAVSNTELIVFRIDVKIFLIFSQAACQSQVNTFANKSKVSDITLNAHQMISVIKPNVVLNAITTMFNAVVSIIFILHKLSTNTLFIMSHKPETIIVISSHHTDRTCLTAESQDSIVVFSPATNTDITCQSEFTIDIISSHRFIRKS